MKPNILLLMCHDLGDHLGCYPGNSASTPNLDRLAAQGACFEQHFAASPTCSPSRGAMLSGLAPHRNGLMALASGGHWELNPAVRTLPQYLQAAGYATACFGIWHISAAFRGIEVGNQDANCDRATANAIAFLENQPAERPFFLMVSVDRPHRPFTTDWPDLQAPEQVTVPGYLADSPAVRQEMVNFYGDVSYMDDTIGQVLTALTEQGLVENTLVIFTSDHGIGMPLAKGTLYDPGLKIPLLMRWPGHIEPGRRCPGLTANVDLLPTVLEAVGLADRMPDDLDGQSLWPFLERDEPVGREMLFFEQTWHDFYEPMRAVRNERYKLIRNFEPGLGWQIAADILPSATVDVMREELRNWPRPPLELYDLAEDPLERNNLAGTPAVQQAEQTLTQQLATWLAQTQDPILAGVVPAPPGYWEHFCAKPAGPGALPPEKGREGWVTVRWPAGATQHRCGR